MGLLPLMVVTRTSVNLSLRPSYLRTRPVIPSAMWLTVCKFLRKTLKDETNRTTTRHM